VVMAIKGHSQETRKELFRSIWYGNMRSKLFRSIWYGNMRSKLFRHNFCLTGFSCHNIMYSISEICVVIKRTYTSHEIFKFWQGLSNGLS